MNVLEERESKLTDHPFMWVAEYEDGTILDEALENGEFRSFTAIRKDTVKTFNLVGRKMRAYIDTSNGIFNLNDVLFSTAIRIGENTYPISSIEGETYKDLIHYKGFYADTIMNDGKIKSTGLNIITNSYHIGWKKNIILNDNQRLSFKMIYSILMGKGIEFEFKLSSDKDIKDGILLIAMFKPGEPKPSVSGIKLGDILPANKSKILKLKLQ